MPIGENESCFRIVSKMTAVVGEGFPFVPNDILTEVMGSAKDSLNDGSYINPEEGVINTRFIGIDEGVNTVETPAGITVETLPADEGLSNFGKLFVSIAVIGVVAIVLIILRKKNTSNLYEMEKLEDDEEFYKDGTPTKGIRDDATDRTGFSSPRSAISNDLDATPSRFVQVLGGGDQDLSIVDDLRSAERDSARASKAGGALHVPYNGNNQGDPTRDVHVCTSAMCEICKPWKNNDPTFIPTSARCSIASPDAKAPRSDYKLERKRAYKTDDTVVL